MIELYAITDDPTPPLPDVGGLTTVASHGLTVVCGPSEDGEVTTEVLWRHEEIVEALMEDRDLLPVRFGTRVDDETAVARAIGERHRAFASALDRVRGAVELGLRVMTVRRDDTGANYLRAKAESASAIHRPLAEEARATRELSPGMPSELLRAAYLVERGRVDSFVERVRSLQSESAHLRLLCTGPWPPYTFAEQ